MMERISKIKQGSVCSSWALSRQTQTVRFQVVSQDVELMSADEVTISMALLELSKGSFLRILRAWRRQKKQVDSVIVIVMVVYRVFRGPRERKVMVQL